MNASMMHLYSHEIKVPEALMSAIDQERLCTSKDYSGVHSIDPDLEITKRDHLSYHWTIGWKTPNEMLESNGYFRSRHLI